MWWHLDLPAVDDGLAEHAVVVADAVAIAGDAQRGHAVEKARGQPPQTAVAQRGIRLQIGQGVHVQTELGQRLTQRGREFERDQRVAEGTADEKLHRQVIDQLGILRVARVRGVEPVLDHQVAHGI